MLSLPRVDPDGPVLPPHGGGDNGDGADFDHSSTLATWFHDAGYKTAFLGKYLNGYPWGRGPYVPAGWDRFLAKRNLDLSTTYAGYPFSIRACRYGGPRSGRTPRRCCRRGVHVPAGGSRDRPWFLLYAPTAPHEPWIPAPQDAGSFAGATWTRRASGL